MGKLARFGVSLDEELLRQFDEIWSQKGYACRSEALRDLIRADISENRWMTESAGCGTLTLVYDHHRHDLARRLMALQHDEHDLIITTMHVHLDHYNCLEVLVLSGERARVQHLAQKLISCKGVKYGVFSPVPDGGRLP